MVGRVEGQTNTDPKVADALIAKEKVVLENLFKGQFSAVNSIMTEDVIYVGENGFASGKMDTSKPFDFGWAEYKPSDFKVVQPDNNTALVMYKNWVKFKDGQTLDSYQTSLWTKRNGEWLTIYHGDVHPYSAKKDESAH